MGCGTGELCRLAADRGATVSGIDAAEGMIDRARARLSDADLRVGAIENLPWDDDSFDVVTGFNSFQFAAERLDGFREARRVARPRRAGRRLRLGAARAQRPPGAVRRGAGARPAADPEEEPEADPAPAFGVSGRARGPGSRRRADGAGHRRRGRPVRDAPTSAQLQGALEFDLVHTGIADSVDRDAFRETVERAAPRAGATTARTASTTRSAGCSPPPERPQSTRRRTIATVPTITISTRSAVGDRRRP